MAKQEFGLKEAERYLRQLRFVDSLADEMEDELLTFHKSITMRSPKKVKRDIKPSKSKRTIRRLL